MSRTLVVYILREVLIYTLVGGVAVAFVFVGGNIPRHLGQLITVGFGLADVYGLVRTLTLMVATYIVPIAFLFGVLLTMGRLAADREVLAMQVSGLGRAALLAPVLALGLVVSGATAYLASEVEYRARTEIRTLLQSLATRGLELEPGAFVKLGPRVLYVRDRGEGGSVAGVMISDRSKRDRPLLILAEKGRFGFDPERNEFRFELTSGEVHVDDLDDRTGYQRVSFASMQYVFDAADLFAVGLGDYRPYDLSNDRLREILDEARNGGSLDRYARKTPVHYEIELQRRFALPAAATLFAWVGVPLGIRVKRGTRSWGAMLCGLLALVYYTALIVGRTLAVKGILPPVVAMWLPNFIIFTAGVLLLRARDAES